MHDHESASEPLQNSEATVFLRLRVGNREVTVEAPLPPPSGRADQLLPIFRQIVDAVVEQTTAETQDAGKSITCRRGCSACCRAQPVPVTPPEAYAIWQLVESLPEPSRSEVRQRFDHNVQALIAAGILEFFTTPRHPELTRDAARKIAQTYFSLRLPCPFLVDDACSIYPDRPFVCRTYMVTSPASDCDDPFRNPVEVVPLPLAPATATLRTMSASIVTPQYTIPLALALIYAERHQVELEQMFDLESLARTWIEQLIHASNPPAKRVEEQYHPTVGQPRACGEKGDAADAAH